MKLNKIRLKPRPPIQHQLMQPSEEAPSLWKPLCEYLIPPRSFAQHSHLTSSDFKLLRLLPDSYSLCIALQDCGASAKVPAR